MAIDILWVSISISLAAHSINWENLRLPDRRLNVKRLFLFSDYTFFILTNYLINIKTILIHFQNNTV